MSLINQMLKDLDKRGSGAGGGEGAGGTIRSVLEPRHSKNRRLPLLIVLLLIVLGCAAGWYFWQHPTTPMPALPPPAAKVDLPKSPAPAIAAATSTSVNPPAVAAPEAASQGKPTENQAARVTQQVDQQDKTAASVRQKQPPSAPVPADGAMKLALLNNALASIPTPSVRKVREPARSRQARRAAVAEKPGVQIKETTPKQQAENAYGNAINLIGTGQKTEAIAALENVLVLNPNHAAARQTLVGLLLDAKRSGDAARVLEAGLKLDPAQLGMAMVLARIQLEQKGSKVALATLQRSLPHAANRPDYLAFVAALLQREKRHKDAAEFYAQALRQAPQNAHWWMGYGISLQANGRVKDARQAFLHARDLHKLSPELQAFVEQKITEIGGV